MKKIGLLTFPRYFNYGTFLQMFALQTVIKNLGYTCEVIDYDRFASLPDRKCETFYFDKIQRLGRVLSDPFSAFQNYTSKKYQNRFEALTAKRRQLYKTFLRDHIKLGAKSYCKYEELKNDPPSCDAFVVGSDQVWHPVSHFKDDSYYLAFAEMNQRIAYAPSMGLSKIPEIAREWVTSGINSIPHISIREEQGAAIIRELTGREALVVADPTLLLTANDWTQSLALPINQRAPYVVCYFLESDTYMRKVAAEIAQKHGYELVIIPVNKVDVDQKSGFFIKEYDVGPIEFISLIKNASFVCTDSFHGTVFSIIFQRRFFTFRRYANPSQAALHSRISSLLTRLGLENREVGQETKLPDYFEIDYETTEKVISDWQDLSRAYLEKALFEATHHPMTSV